MKTNQLPPELVEKMRVTVSKHHITMDVPELSNECAQIAVEYADERSRNRIKELEVKNRQIINQRDELLEAMREFTNAIESEEITIQENCDNDGWENCGGRLYETFKKLINKIDGK